MAERFNPLDRLRRGAQRAGAWLTARFGKRKTGGEPHPLLRRRIQRAAESILENESLTADLDDAAAQVLLDWGVACAEQAAQETEGLDDAAAEEAMAPRLRATRKLMRLVNRWAGQSPAPEAVELLDEILAQAATIYGARLSPPDESTRSAFVNACLGADGDPVRRIAELRAWLERP